MKLSISEILDQCSRLTTTKAKVEYLRQNQSQPLFTVLQCALHPNVKWALPEGAPPYKPCDLPDQEARLYQEARRLYLFLEGGNPNLNPVRRETLFIQLLESIDPTDAKLMISVKDKKIPYKGITEKVVGEAFPGIFN